jgi:type I restriction enzyme S subunit
METMAIAPTTTWITKPIGEVLDVVTGNTPSKKEVANMGDYIPFVKPPELQNEVIREASESLSELGAKSARVVPTGSVLVSCIGNLGRVGLADRPVAFNQQINALKPHRDLEPKYLFYYFQGPLFRQALERAATATTVALVNKGNFEKLPLTYPPLPQQRRIVSAIELQLGRLDAAVARLHAAKARLKRYKQAVLKAAVEGALTEEWREKNKKKLPSAEKVIADLKKARDEAFKKLQNVERGDGERQVRKPKDIEPLTEDELAALPELPEDWAYARVGNAVNDIFDGPFGSHLKSVDYIDAGVRVIRLENIVFLGFRDDLKSYVSEEKYSTIRNHTVGAGDIIFSSFINDQTRVAVLPDHIELAINKSDCFCVRIGNVPMDRNYVHYFLSSDLAYSIHGATRPRINTTQLKQCPIPICGLEEQREIARLVGEALAATEAMETTLDSELLQSTRLRQAVLKRAFEGRLV